MVTFRCRLRPPHLFEDAVRTLGKEFVGRLPANLLWRVQRALNVSPNRPSPVRRDDDARDRQPIAGRLVSKGADWHLAPAAEPLDDGSFGPERHSGTDIPDGLDHVSGAPVALSNFDGYDALTRCRHADLHRQQCRDSIPSFQTPEPGCGQHDRIIVAGVQFPQSSVEVSSYRQELPG